MAEEKSHSSKEASSHHHESHFALIAIVAIVAIVGLVVLIGGEGATKKTDVERQAVIGEASGVNSMCELAIRQGMSYCILYVRNATTDECRAWDFNKDGIVDVSDMLIFMSQPMCQEA